MGLSVLIYKARVAINSEVKPALQPSRRGGGKGLQEQAFVVGVRMELRLFCRARAWVWPLTLEVGAL